MKIKAGFLGQKMFVLPEKIIENCQKSKLIKPLFLTDIGYFPQAKNHYIERKTGSKEFLLIYCHKGIGELIINNNKIILEPHSYFIIPPNVPHVYKADMKNPWSIYWLHFQGSHAKHIYTKFKDITKNNSINILFLNNRIKLFENLISVLEDGYRKTNILYVNLALYQLLNSFLFPDFFKQNSSDENLTITDSIIKFLKKNITESLTVKDIAKQFNYSPSYFLSFFKKNTGFSPISYFNDLKIQTACQYLSFTEMNVKEISYMLAFNDPHYFSRLFKKSMGISPKEYRKRYSQ